MPLLVPKNATNEFTPRLYPPFPTDTTPCAKLDTFCLSTLQAGDPSEKARLLEVCKTRGFFYLDFAGSEAEGLSMDAELIGHLAEEFFRLPLDEKMRYQSGSGKPCSILGYKVAGYTKTDLKGTPDTAEFMNIGKDDVLDNPTRTPVRLPALALVPKNRASLATYQTKCHGIGMTILAILAGQLGLSPDVFEDKHRISEPSDDHIRMTRGPARKDILQAEIQTPGHTDFGTITILFNWLAGLQIWSESSRGDFDQLFDGAQSHLNPVKAAGWTWVKPKPGLAIINLGDAAVKFTGGVLCSGRHRVVPAPGEQSLWPRYSIVYFVRPEDKCVLKRITGGSIPHLMDGEEEEELTAQQWIKKRADMLRDGAAKACTDA